MYDNEDDDKSTPEVLKRFIGDYKEHIEDTEAYIESRNWGIKIQEENFDHTVREHIIQWNLIQNISERLKYFMDEAKNELHKKYAIDFVKLLKGLLEGYIERCNIYRKLNKWSEIADNDQYMDKQITFQDILLKNINILRKVMGKINLDEAKGETKSIPIHGDKIVPFLMQPVIEKHFPKQFQK